MKRSERPISYECGCALSPEKHPDGRLAAWLCRKHQGELISMLSMNGRYVANHNAHGERLVVVAEPIAVKS